MSENMAKPQLDKAKPAEGNDMTVCRSKLL